MTRQPLQVHILSSSMHSRNSTWHCCVWLVGVEYFKANFTISDSISHSLRCLDLKIWWFSCGRQWQTDYFTPCTCEQVIISYNNEKVATSNTAWKMVKVVSRLRVAIRIGKGRQKYMHSLIILQDTAYHICQLDMVSSLSRNEEVVQAYLKNKIWISQFCTVLNLCECTCMHTHPELLENGMNACLSSNIGNDLQLKCGEKNLYAYIFQYLVHVHYQGFIQDFRQGGGGANAVIAGLRGGNNYSRLFFFCEYGKIIAHS